MTRQIIVKLEQHMNISKHDGFSLIELLIVVAMISVITAIAVPNLIASRRAANEGSAESSLRTIHTAQSTYLATAGANNYGTLDTLRTQSLVDATLGGGSKSGYTFQCAAANLAAGPPPTFYATGNPTNTAFGTRSGHRTFTIAEDGLLRGKNSDVGPADHAEAINSATWPALNH